MKNVRRILQIDDIHKDGIRGKGIGVAILDTGIFLHNDFVRPVARIAAFKDFVNGKIDLYDDNGHGTHVAGICASNGYASKGLYKGIAPECYIISLKVLDSYGIGKVENVERALEWVLKNKEKYNIRIVNLSIGTYGINKIDTTRLISAVENAWDRGLVILTAAGNKGPKPQSITDPGTSKKIITVGASEEYIYYQNNGRKMLNYSGCGPTKESIVKPEVVAPGSNIISCTNKNNVYISKSGTSMSTPIVSGIVALGLGCNDKKDGMNKYIKKLLFETSLDLGKDKNKQGWGLINAKGVINAFLGKVE